MRARWTSVSVTLSSRVPGLFRSTAHSRLRRLARQAGAVSFRVVGRRSLGGPVRRNDQPSRRKGCDRQRGRRRRRHRRRRHRAATAQQTGRSSSRSRTVATAVRGRHGASKSEGSGILVRLTQPQFVAPPAASHLQYSYIPDTGPDRLHHSVIPHSITPSLHHLISPALGCVAWLLATWVQRSWSWCHGVVEIRSRGCPDRP